MAKIAARGDRERARWRQPLTGAEYVLTERGRLLHKWQRGAGFVVATKKKLELAGAEDFVARVGRGGYDRV